MSEKDYCEHGIHMAIRCIPCELRRLQATEEEKAEEEDKKSIQRISDSLRKY